MSGRLFFDTNLIVHAMDPQDPARRVRSAALIREAMSRGRLVVSPQLLNECYRVLVHGRRFAAPMEVSRYLSVFHPACTAPVDLQTHRAAIAIETRHRLAWWDSVAVASALQGRCEHFVSEDLNDGQVIETLTVVNPFTTHARAILALS
ncbi:PIN domain-containing protein [Methylobacterium segetis]|uniref:PIN domain-containing protein n=1 Tax=Methylobacterium segetis TaxID=2488750 RepID=UPI0014049431|nr:PIN domain-containing protein [Methylobacterium segetis]